MRAGSHSVEAVGGDRLPCLRVNALAIGQSSGVAVTLSLPARCRRKINTLMVDHGACEERTGMSAFPRDCGGPVVFTPDIATPKPRKNHQILQEVPMNKV